MYELSAKHPVLPTDRDYGDEILAALPEGLIRSSVFFVGPVRDGVDEWVTRWDVAVLNPTGYSEADPASVKDCLRSGIPIEGGNVYVMTDYLRHFPETRLHQVSELEEVLLRLERNPALRAELAERSRTLWDSLVHLDDRLVARFLGMIEAVEDGDGRELKRLIADQGPSPLDLRVHSRLLARKRHERRKRRQRIR